MSAQEVQLGAEAISDCICKALQREEGALIGRNGSIELSMLLDPSTSSADPRLRILATNAGIYDMKKDAQTSFLQWHRETKSAILNTDVLAMGWYQPLAELESKTFSSWSVLAKQIPLRSLEPYYVSTEFQWIKYLKGQKVAVVSSFTYSAADQATKGLNTIWSPRLDWPSEIDWIWIQTGHPPFIANGTNEWPPGIHSWSDAIEMMVEKIVWSGARFALIGCGGLGMILASKLKDRGVIALVLGGSIQVLFGIKGKRWETHSVIGKFWNDQWIWPSLKETPGNAQSIEGGCYWASKN